MAKSLFFKRKKLDSKSKMGDCDVKNYPSLKMQKQQ